MLAIASFIGLRIAQNIPIYLLVVFRNSLTNINNMLLSVGYASFLRPPLHIGLDHELELSRANSRRRLGETRH